MKKYKSGRIVEFILKLKLLFILNVFLNILLNMHIFLMEINLQNNMKKIKIDIRHRQVSEVKFLLHVEGMTELGRML